MAKTYPIPVTKEEMQRLMDACLEDEYFYMFFTVAKTTGRRMSEYYNVKVKDIDFEKGIMMTQILKRKKYVLKEAVLLPEPLRLLKIHIRKQGLKLDDYVFRKVSKRQIHNMVKKYAKLAGIEHNVSFHNFRHYFITELVRKGWNYEKISKLTGHSSIGTLVHYDSATASDIKEDALMDVADL